MHFVIKESMPKEWRILLLDSSKLWMENLWVGGFIIFTSLFLGDLLIFRFFVAIISPTPLDLEWIILRIGVSWKGAGPGGWKPKETFLERISYSVPEGVA